MTGGRSFTEAEERSGAAVCILGQTVRTTLFGKADPVGARVRLGTVAFTVLGVLQAKGHAGFGMDQDDVALIPLATLQRRLSGTTDVGMVYISAKDGVSTSRVQADIERLLRERRRIGAAQTLATVSRSTPKPLDEIALLVAPATTIHPFLVYLAPVRWMERASAPAVGGPS